MVFEKIFTTWSLIEERWDREATDLFPVVESLSILKRRVHAAASASFACNSPVRLSPLPLGVAISVGCHPELFDPNQLRIQ